MLGLLQAYAGRNTTECTRVLAVQRPAVGTHQFWKASLAMAIAQPERGGLLPERTAPSAALSPPPPAWRPCRSATSMRSPRRRAARSPSPSRTTASTGTSATAPRVHGRRRGHHQGAAQGDVPGPPNPPGRFFSFTLDNDHLAKLARTPVSVHKILVVMIVPRSRDQWPRGWRRPARSSRHRCYRGANVPPEPRAPAGRRTTVRIPTARVFDDRALCEIMTAGRDGRKP